MGVTMVTELHKIDKDMPLMEPNIDSATADGKIQLVLTTRNRVIPRE